MAPFREELQRPATWLRVSLKKARILSPVLLLSMVAAATAAASGVLPSSALADPTYGVMNAPEGVYWRSEPNWAAAERTTGFGVYNGTTIEVHCYQSGTTVEGSADTMWEQATDVGGSGYGSGWLNEHFINDGQPINQPSPGVPPCNAPPPPPPPPPPPSSGGLVFPIFNAEGGIYYRNSPHWSDTSATLGVGVYNGDQVELICGAFGDAVGPYNDTAWSYVNNLSRPVGDGWVNEHFINDGALSNQFVAGEPMCGPEIPGATSSGGSGSSGGGSGLNGDGSTLGSPSGPSGGGSTGPNSVFYSPNSTPDAIAGLTLADLNIVLDEWTEPHCGRTAAANIPAGVSTLAGWSLARLGPVYFLAAASSQQVASVRTIILIDPGDTKDFKEGCDVHYGPDWINSLFHNWLKSNTANRLIVLTGAASEEEQHGKATYAGLWKYYFAGIWNQHFAKQAQVCDYHQMDHKVILKEFAWMVQNPVHGCPTAKDHAKLTAWNP
jgi:hypothetical protein